MRQRTRELEEANRELEQRTQTLEKFALTDGLTLLPNRKALDHFVERELYLCRRFPAPLAVAIIDVDFFKEINTTFHHPGGDQVLGDLARCMTAALRKIDMLGRWAGDEFMLIAPQTHRAGALVLAERLRALVQNHPSARGPADSGDGHGRPGGAGGGAGGGLRAGQTGRRRRPGAGQGQRPQLRRDRGGRPVPGRRRGARRRGRRRVGLSGSGSQKCRRRLTFSGRDLFLWRQHRIATWLAVTGIVMKTSPARLDDCPASSSVSLSTDEGCSLTMWGGDPVKSMPTGELKTEVGPDRPLVIGRQDGGETPYLDPRYRPTPLAPIRPAPSSPGNEKDNWVSRGHFMIKASPTGVVLVNGVPHREGGIRPPLNGTWLVAPVQRRMEAGEEYLILRGTSVQICLPNASVVLIARTDAARIMRHPGKGALMVNCPRCLWGDLRGGRSGEHDVHGHRLHMPGGPGCGHEFLPLDGPGAAHDKADRPAEPGPGDGRVRFAELTEEDRQRIAVLVQLLPGLDGRVIRIIRHSDGEVQVFTGDLAGRRADRGGSVLVERASGGWRVRRISSWLE